MGVVQTFLNGFVGNNIKNSTFIDILNDTWGSSAVANYGGNHLSIEVPLGYEYLYTPGWNPSIEGYKK